MRRGFWTDFQITPAAIFAAWPLELFLIFMAARNPWLAWLLVSIIVGGAVAVVWLRVRPGLDDQPPVPVPMAGPVVPDGMYPCPECGRLWPSERPPADDAWRCPDCWARTPAR